MSELADGPLLGHYVVVRGWAEKPETDALAPKLVHLTITLAPGARVPGLEIKRDGQLVSNAELGIDVPIDPGPHTVEASAPGLIWTRTADLSAPLMKAWLTPWIWLTRCPMMESAYS